MATPKKDPSALLGAVIENRFILQSVIGQGGLSTVYKAQHKVADRDAAVKILHDDYSNTTESVQRFEREAVIINRLNHPNIVHMYSFGVLSGDLEKMDGAFEMIAEPRPYLVLELLRGEGLDKLLDITGKLPMPAIIEIMDGVFEGLKAAHELGVVHRDIKPSNIMILREIDEYDSSYPGSFTRRVKLLDFGIAKCNKCHDEKAKALTQPGYVFGSPNYMSPEQCMGRDIDLRSDIYSLGCMLYEMLTGNPPFEGENAMHTFAMHIYEQPKPLNTHEGLANVSNALEEVVQKSLSKEVEARYESVDAFRTAFSAAMQN
jgi:eukaryotic-like serine/threonine-protein kinase